MESLKDFPSLSFFLLFKRSSSYAWYRTRYYSLNSFFRGIIFWLDLVIIFPLISLDVFFLAFATKVSLFLLESFYWGGLEFLREAIRVHRKEKKICQITINQWLSNSLFLGILLIFASFTWMWIKGFSLYSLYIFILCFSSAIHLNLKTLHSGIFALARIPRPLWSLLASPAVLFICALSTWPFLKEYCWPLAIFISTLARFCLSCSFILRKYQHFQIFPLKNFSWFLNLKLWKDSTFWLPGLSFASTQCTLVISSFICFFLLADYLTPYSSLFLFFPLLDVCFHWTQLFYFDLKKTALSPLLFFKEIENLSIKVGMTMSVLTLLAMSSIALANHQLQLILPFAPLTLWQCLIGSKEMSLFSEKNYQKSLCTMSIPMLGFLAWINQYIHFPALCFCLVLGAIAAYLPFVLPAKRRDIIGIYDYLLTTSKYASSCRIGQLSVSPSCKFSQQVSIAKRLISSLPSIECISCLSNETILWLEKKSQHPLEIAEIAKHAMGLAKEISLHSWHSSGAESLMEAFPFWKEEAPSSENMLHLFQTDMPQKEGSFISSSNSSKTFLLENNYLYYLKPYSLYQKNEIITFYNPIKDQKLFFSLSSHAKATQARKWKSLIKHWNVQLYLQKILSP